jgi:transcriptional regulator with XRE-family HTH domain
MRPISSESYLSQENAMDIDPAAWSREVPGALRRFRLRTALPQAEVAKRAELATSTLSSWERGHASPHLDGLLRLLSVLRVDLADLQREIFRGVQITADGAESSAAGPHTGRVSVVDRRMAAKRGADHAEVTAERPEPLGQGPRSMREGGMMVWWAVEEMNDGADAGNPPFGSKEDEERFERTLENLRDAVHRQLLHSWLRRPSEETETRSASDDDEDLEERSEAS